MTGFTSLLSLNTKPRFRNRRKPDHDHRILSQGAGMRCKYWEWGTCGTWAWEKCVRDVMQLRLLAGSRWNWNSLQ